MKSKINVKTGNIGTNDINKRRGLEASVLIGLDAGSPINTGSLLNAGRLFEVLR